MRFLNHLLAVSVLRFYLRIVLITCRWKTENLYVLKNAMKKKEPIMLACWHENLVSFACFFKSWEKKLWVISSTHRDSRVLATILKSWEYKLIKGSSTRGWLSVLKKLIKVFSTPKSIVAITNDGPRGPAKQSKPGALKVALKHNVRIVGMSSKVSSFWRLKTWDKMILPKPFSTIRVCFYPEYTDGYNLKLFNDYLNQSDDGGGQC